jgi:tetratricopeptide (TPR) repeat protein
MGKELDRLVLRLRGKEQVERFAKIDSYEMNKLKSLGYFSEGSVSRKKAFTVENDLKTLAPFEIKVFGALDKYKEGKTQEAIKDGLEVIEERPDFLLAYTLLANIYYALGQPNNSIEIIRTGLKHNPKNVGLMSKLGIMLLSVGQNEEAIDILMRCIKKDDRNPEYFNYLGVAYQKSGNFELALENYKRTIELDSNFALPWNNMGSLYLTKYAMSKNERDLQRALDCFNTALAFDPTLKAAVNGRNAALKFKGKLQERNTD